MIDISTYTAGDQIILRHMDLRDHPDLNAELRPYYGKAVTVTQIDCIGKWIKFDGNQRRFSPACFDPLPDPEPPDASELNSFLGF